METTVKQRLLEYLRSKNISIREFERLAGLSNGYMANLRRSPTAERVQNILSAFPDMNRTWLLTGEGEMLKSESGTQSFTDGSPYFSALTIQGGAPNGNGDEAFTLANMSGRILIPGLPMGNDIPYIRVRGNSMLNRNDTANSIPAGSIIGIRKCQSSVIRWGEVYAFMTEDGPVVKKLLPSDDNEYVRCVSFNEEDGYYPFDLPKSEIIGSLYDVVAVISITTR